MLWARIVTGYADSNGLKALINEGALASSIEAWETLLRVYYFHDGNKYPHLPLHVWWNLQMAER